MRFIFITAIGMCPFLPVHHFGMASLAGSKVNIQQQHLSLKKQQKGRVNPYQLSEFLRGSLMLFIIKDFRTNICIFIVISTTFRPIYPLAIFSCLSNQGTSMELRTTSFIESTGIACADSVSHNQVEVLSIPVLLLACSRD